MLAAVPRALAGLALVTALAAPAPARADDEFDGASVIFARSASLYRVDARGRGEVELAQLPAKVTVRALRSDAAGGVLLADLAGKWAWMPLDGSTRSLTELPCGDGPAQLAEDGTAVLCRSARAPAQSIIVELARGAAAGGPARLAAVDVPPGAARLVGSGAERALVWADAGGVWTAPASDPRRRTRAALDVPLRSFLPSPDGERAIAVYADEVFTDPRHKQAAEVLMMLQLDGRGARRKAIRDGVPVEWSHDAEWLLVQDGSGTCLMKASGGQYKCWRGLTASSVSSDGRWALALGNRDGSRTAIKPAGKPAGKPKGGKPAARPAPPRPAPVDAELPRPDDKPWDHLDEPSDEPESRDAPPPADDVSVAPPRGPLSLYRLRLEGAFTDRPTLLVKIVDGAAVWVPGAP